MLEEKRRTLADLGWDNVGAHRRIMEEIGLHRLTWKKFAEIGAHWQIMGQRQRSSAHHGGNRFTSAHQGQTSAHIGAPWEKIEAHQRIMGENQRK